MIKRVSLFLGLLFAASAASAVKTDSENPLHFFRYYDEKHESHIDQQISEEHLRFGYDELDSHMQVIRSVPPRPTEKDMERIRAEEKRKAQEEQRAKDDAQLRRLYSSAEDAERARDRQLDAIQLRIDFNTNSLVRLRALRAQEAQRAAGFERNGKPVPKDILKNVDKYDKQILDVQSEMKDHKADQDRLRADFEPTIQRLREIDNSKRPGPTANAQP